MKIIDPTDYGQWCQMLNEICELQEQKGFSPYTDEEIAAMSGATPKICTIEMPDD